MKYKYPKLGDLVYHKRHLITGIIVNLKFQNHMMTKTRILSATVLWFPRHVSSYTTVCFSPEFGEYIPGQLSFDTGTINIIGRVKI